MTSAFVTAFQPPYFHFTAIAAALVLLCLIFTVSRFHAYFADLRKKWNPPAPYEPLLLGFKRRAFWLWLCLLIPALLLLGFAIYLTTYQWVGNKIEVAGEVTSFHHGAITFRDNRGQVTTYPVQGSKQAAAGLFLQFPSWMRYIGLATYHQLIGFRGPAEMDYRYQKAPPEYISRFGDPFFTFVYKNQGWLFISARYEESPYFSGPGHRIIVTHSGYIVQ